MDTTGLEVLADFKVPALFIVGEDDIVVPPEMARICAGFIPGARLEIVPGTGHSVYFERPDVFNGLVEAFIASCEDSTP